MAYTCYWPTRVIRNAGMRYKEVRFHRQLRNAIPEYTLKLAASSLYGAPVIITHVQCLLYARDYFCKSWREVLAKRQLAALVVLCWKKSFQDC